MAGTAHILGALAFTILPMRFEKFVSQKSAAAGRPPVIIKTSDAVVYELTHPKPLDRARMDTKRALERIFRAGNRGRKVVVSGETKAIAAWVHSIMIQYAEVR